MRVASVFLSLISGLAVVNAAYTPRSRNIQKRHAAILHARAPAPAAAPAPHVVRKRDSKKCKPRPSSSSIAPVATHVAPANPASAPTETHKEVTPTTHAAPPTTQAPQPTTHTTPKASPTTTAQQHTTTQASGGGGGGGGSTPFGSFFSGTQSGERTPFRLILLF